MSIGNCGVCNWSNIEFHWISKDGNPYDAQTYFSCPRCGTFVIDDAILRSAEFLPDKALLPFLSSYIRRNQSGVRADHPVITKDRWRELAVSEKSVTVPQKLERLLRLIGDRTTFLGEFASVDPDIDAPRFNALNINEVSFLLSALRDSQFVDLGSGNTVLMKVKGWEQIMPKPGSEGTPGTCFVAMSFDPALNDVFNLAIEPAAIACSFKAMRIDRKEHNGKIDDEIMAEIKKGQFTIADFTGHRAGVYFEAGFARGLGREVIWCCKREDLHNSHFDTRQYNHIDWIDLSDLRQRLTNRILATIPNAKASG